jgi:hypothetical protein
VSFNLVNLAGAGSTGLLKLSQRKARHRLIALPSILRRALALGPTAAASSAAST